MLALAPWNKFYYVALAMLVVCFPLHSIYHSSDKTVCCIQPDISAKLSHPDPDKNRSESMR